MAPIRRPTPQMSLASRITQFLQAHPQSPLFNRGPNYSHLPQGDQPGPIHSPMPGYLPHLLPPQQAPANYSHLPQGEQPFVPHTVYPAPHGPMPLLNAVNTPSFAMPHSLPGGPVQMSPSILQSLLAALAPYGQFGRGQ